MWKIEYSKEVRSYLYDSYPYTEIIWQTIKALRSGVTGVPLADYEEFALNWFFWQVADHLVIYERRVAQGVLYVQVVKPDADDEYRI